jgi:hypothetical protein
MMQIQEYLVYAVVAVCVVWAAVRIYRNINKIRRGQNVCNGCQGACGGKVEGCCGQAEKRKK